MAEELKQAIVKLEKTKEFKDFKKKNSKTYLASCVVIMDGKNIGAWQADYYIPKKHKMATFILKEKMELKGEDEIFQKEKKEVEKLDLNEVKISFDEMIKLLDSFRKEKYSGDLPNKIVVVLQTLNDKTIWNITCLTDTLKVLNVKINAQDGKVLEDNIENVLSFRSPAS